MLQARGVTDEMLGRLVIDGLAAATSQIVHAGKWPFKVVHIQILRAAWRGPIFFSRVRADKPGF
jgi:hypothetical protein